LIPLQDINPAERFAVVALILFILNVIVFIYELALGIAGEVFANAFALVPANLLTHAPRTVHVIPAVATLFTSMFLHGGLLTLAGNILYIWIFVNNV
jgi:rhomboid family protein